MPRPSTVSSGDRDGGEHHRVADRVPPVGVGQQVDEVGEADELRGRQVRQVGVGEARTRSCAAAASRRPSASTSSIGATNSQAARVRWRVRRERARPPSAGTAGSRHARSLPWRPPCPARPIGARYQRPPRDSRSSFFSSAARLAAASRLPAQHLVHGVEELGADLVVLGAGDPRRPRHRVDEDLVERAEERHRRQHLRVLVERFDGRVVGALDRAPLLLLLRGQVADEVGRERRGACCRSRRRAASRPACRCSCRRGRPSGRAATPILSLIGLSRRLPERPGIGPVAHEDGVAGLEDAARLLLAVVRARPRARSCRPMVAAQVDRLGGLGVVDR